MVNVGTTVFMAHGRACENTAIIQLIQLMSRNGWVGLGSWVGGPGMGGWIWEGWVSLGWVGGSGLDGSGMGGWVWDEMGWDGWECGDERILGVIAMWLWVAFLEELLGRFLSTPGFELPARHSG